MTTFFFTVLPNAHLAEYVQPFRKRWLCVVLRYLIGYRFVKMTFFLLTRCIRHHLSQYIVLRIHIKAIPGQALWYERSW